MIKQATISRRALALACAAILSACGSGEQQAPPPPAVKVYTVKPVEVPRVVELPGRVQAIRTSEVRARVDGIIERRLYQEGTDVKAGDKLFLIDPREMQAAYDQATGALSRAQATARNASQVVERYKPLVGKEAISKQEYDAAVAASAQAEADVVSAQAAVERGDAGSGLRDGDGAAGRPRRPGAGDRGGAGESLGSDAADHHRAARSHLCELHPILERPAEAAPRYRGREVKSLPLNRIRVTLTLEDGSVYEKEGHLNFLDMAVDSSTGSVSVRAEFENPHRLLLPGQFVRAKVEGSVIENGIVVPQRAVQLKPEGATVLVVGKNNVAESRPVKLSTLHGTAWAVESGLKPGDKVITDGVQHVKVGAPVRIEAEAGLPPIPAAASKPN